MADVVHLAKHIHDVTCDTTEIWCDADQWSRNETQYMENATCLDCLAEAISYGNEALKRREEVRIAAAKAKE